MSHMNSKYLDLSAFSKSHPDAASPVNAQVKTGLIFEKKQINEQTYEVDFVASTEAYDRMGDSIKLDGWELDRFRKNPVILFGHDYYSFPVGKAVDVAVRNGALMVKIKFAVNESEAAKECWELVKGGYLNAVSVGFIPKRWEYRSQDGDTPSGMDVMAAELLEISIVPVPAHQDALIQARSAGIQTQLISKMLLQDKQFELDAQAQIDLAKKNIEAQKKAEAEEGDAGKSSTSPDGAEPDQKSAAEDEPMDGEGEEDDNEDKGDKPKPACEADGKSQPDLAAIETLISQQTKSIIEALVGQKAGRTISAKNEELLRAAHDALGKVLSQLENSGETGDKGLTAGSEPMVKSFQVGDFSDLINRAAADTVATH